MPEESWHAARLIPTSGINGAEEQERRATSALLAVMSAVREFGRALTQPLGAPAGSVQTFIEVPFKLAAPDTLGGLKRSGVRLIASDRTPAALVTYGRGLGGIAVIESQARPQHDHGAAIGDLRLPTVAIGDAAGRELTTALGTAISFTRDGVDYVVLGSVTAATAEAAARGL